jgi:predicted NAD/FAD-binding protein
MSFGFSLDQGRMEYACDDLNKLFAQRLNVLSPRFVTGVREILRFNRIGIEQLEAGSLDGLTLREWLKREAFTDWFRDCFLIPMGGAIWSTPCEQMLDFPAESFITFFRNHDLMVGFGEAVQWRTVEGGSRSYVDRVSATLGGRIRTNSKVISVSRGAIGPELRFSDGSTAQFDHVIFACHGPEAFGLRDDLDAEERAILGTFRTTPNTAVLHSDPRLMPKRKRVWSSWNFLASTDKNRSVPVTYWMNRLQSIDEAYPLFVSLDPEIEPDPDKVHSVQNYAHPMYDQASIDAQDLMLRIQGRGNLWYAGAWLGYGFHEDGLRSGVRVARWLGADPVWAAPSEEAELPTQLKAAE